MKELYFSVQSIETQAQELLQHVADIVPIKLLEYQPAQSALLVLDMQYYFLDPASHAYIPSSGAILARIQELVDAYYAHQWPVFFTQHINTSGNAGLMSEWWKDLITPRGRMHEITSEINLSGGKVIQKSQYDAFHQTQLDEMLHDAGVTQVVICGVMTHLCCETTARSAFMRGYKVFFPVDGTATYNLAFHRASLVNLSHGFASLVLVKDILAAICGDRED